MSDVTAANALLDVTANSILTSGSFTLSTNANLQFDVDINSSQNNANCSAQLNLVTVEKIAA